MARALLSTLFFAALLAGCQATEPTSQLKLPNYIKPCRRSDPKLNECVVRNGRAAIPKFLNGDPKYKVPRLDPLEIKELRIQQGSDQLGLTMLLKEAKVFGLRDAEFVAARTDLKKKHVEWDFYHPYLTILGKYDMAGKVLVIPIRGQGTANITLTNMKTRFKFDFILQRREDGEEYMKVTKSDLKADIGKSHFRFTNLFNGDKLLGETVNRFLNDNNREVVQEMGAPVVNSIANVFKIILDTITELVPYHLIYLP